MLDLCDNPTNGKVLCVVVHAQLLVLDLLDRLQLVAAETTCAATTGTWTARRLRGESRL
jgi:hypothetical protein